MKDIDQIIIVHLRRPVMSNPNEMRSDPFWEFGSFGCTRCHSRNLMNPKKAHELEGVRLAFAQGGRDGFKLVHLSPPVTIIQHRDRCEAKWTPIEMPFKYVSAPMLIDNNGNSDVPELLELLRNTDRTTWVAKFSSKFRTRRRPFIGDIAKQIVAAVDRFKSASGKSVLANDYWEALPKSPPKPDKDRKATYKSLLDEAAGLTPRNHGCRG